MPHATLHRKFFRKALNAAKLVVTSPGSVPAAIKRNLGLKQREPDWLKQISRPKRNESAKTLTHVAFFTHGNAGDTLLPVTVRDLITHFVGAKHWRNQHAHHLVQPAHVGKINQTSGVIIGGGGLFLRDTNPNKNSGWQWNCPMNELRQISVPMAVFAVGYNRFRGQDDFDPVFRDHLNLLAEKSAFIGLRNSGSIRAIKSYLEPALQSKVRFQPCMTTLCSRIYPHLMKRPMSSRPMIALNMAFDRSHLRFGDQEEEHLMLQAVAQAMKKLSSNASIQYFSHLVSDEKFLPYLESAGVKFSLVKLHDIPAQRVVKLYSQPSLVIGMRGHAQLIPFGCQRPIISLISHDKMRWFLDDIRAPDWGLEVSDPDISGKLVQLSQQLISSPEATASRLKAAQDELWNFSSTNVRDLAAAFSLSTVR